MNQHSLIHFCLALVVAATVPLSAPAADPFLVEVYDGLHASARQTKIRRIAPMPVGAVFIQRPGEGDAEIREHFRTMRRLGFTALSGICPVPGWEEEQIALIAVDEGIVPWWYGEASGEAVTAGLRRRLNVDANSPLSQVRSHPRMVTQGLSALRKRVEKMLQAKKAGQTLHTQAPAYMKEFGPPGVELPRNAKSLFVRWCQLQYGTIDQLNKAYNLHHYGLGDPFISWSDFGRRWEYLPRRTFRLSRDIFRFQADRRLEQTNEWIQELQAFDSAIPFRAGGETGLFVPAPYWGVDFERVADMMSEAGSFQPSMHLTWHFHEVEHEITRPAYMQASLASDLFKGGWVGAWETSGGPQQTSGGKTGAVFTVDEHVVTQLMLSQLAGGMRGFGFWSWGASWAGGEAGEYALLDRQNEVTPRAIRAGQVGQAARNHRDELWQARKQPLVGVYVDGENDAVWSAMSLENRDELRQFPMQARVGVSRALMNANIPFEFVTADDLAAGLAGRYRIVYLPAILSLREATLFRLRQYVLQGGRVVIDMPGAWYNENTVLMPTNEGSLFETMFGTVINDFQGAGVNRSYQIDGFEVTGFVIDTTPTTARVVSRYDNGKPAITEVRSGEGMAVVLGYEASRMCSWKGSRRAQKMLLRHTLGGYGSPYSCTWEPVENPAGGRLGSFARESQPLIYRLAAPAADHYFVINDGPAKKVTLNTRIEYQAMRDAVTGQLMLLGEAFIVQRDSGRWLRLVK